MKEYNDDEVKNDARIVLLIALGLGLIFLLFALILLPGLLTMLLDPMSLYENGLSNKTCFQISILVTLALMIFFTLVAGERFLAFDLTAKLILAGVPVFLIWFWLVLAWLF